jgi:hypothetical protein
MRTSTPVHKYRSLKTVGEVHPTPATCKGAIMSRLKINRKCAPAHLCTNTAA